MEAENNEMTRRRVEDYYTPEWWGRWLAEDLRNNVKLLFPEIK